MCDICAALAYWCTSAVWSVSIKMRDLVLFWYTHDNQPCNERGRGGLKIQQYTLDRGMEYIMQQYTLSTCERYMYKVYKHRYILVHMHVKYVLSPLLADKKANLYMSMVIKSTNTLFLSHQCMPFNAHVSSCLIEHKQHLLI